MGLFLTLVVDNVHEWKALTSIHTQRIGMGYESIESNLKLGVTTTSPMGAP